MNVKQFAEATALSSHTIRYYEKIGLIPKVQRDASGFRRYSEEDVAWLEALKTMKSMGMSLKDIKHSVLLRQQGSKTIAERIKIYEKHYQKLLDQIHNLQVKITKTKCRLGQCKKSCVKS